MSATSIQLAALHDLANHHRTYDDDAAAIRAVLSELAALRAGLAAALEENGCLRLENGLVEFYRLKDDNAALAKP